MKAHTLDEPRVGVGNEGHLPNLPSRLRYATRAVPVTRTAAIDIGLVQTRRNLGEAQAAIGGNGLSSSQAYSRCSMTIS
jgi:hypothetical protein